jgi:hypothetical protein
MRQALAGRQLLLILDDVTTQSQLDALDVLGPGSVTLFTTRHDGVPHSRLGVSPFATGPGVEFRPDGPTSNTEAGRKIAVRRLSVLGKTWGGGRIQITFPDGCGKMVRRAGPVLRERRARNREIAAVRPTRREAP